MTTYTDISAEETIRYVQWIAARLTSIGYVPDLVIGPTRGGLIPGVMMSHCLSIPFFPVSYSLRDHKADADLPSSLVQFVNDKRDSTVLLIDDIIDTGKTFAGLHNHLRQHIPEAAIISAGLIVNEEQPISAFAGKTIKRSQDDSWYRFFWEIS